MAKNVDKGVTQGSDRLLCRPSKCPKLKDNLHHENPLFSIEKP